MEKEPPQPRNGAVSFPIIVFFLCKQRKLPVRKKFKMPPMTGGSNAACREFRPVMF